MNRYLYMYFSSCLLGLCVRPFRRLFFILYSNILYWLNIAIQFRVNMTTLPSWLAPRGNLLNSIRTEYTFLILYKNCTTANFYCGLLVSWSENPCAWAFFLFQLYPPEFCIWITCILRRASCFVILEYRWVRLQPYY